MKERDVQMDFILHANQIVKEFGGLRAVDAVTLSVDRGLCFGLLGPNGAGKTTLIEIMEGILDSDSGTVSYKGNPIAASFKQEIGIMFQQTALPGYLTVKETLFIFQKLYKRRAAIEDIISCCNLENVLEKMNDRISGGQRQRLLLALALVNDPDLLFMDEPSTGLDPQARRTLWDMVFRIKSKGKTVILTTHYMEEAQELCDEIAIMDHGKIIAKGTPDRLIREHGSDPTLMIPDYHIRASYKEIADQMKTAVKVTEKRGWIAFQSRDINGLISELLKRNIELSEMSLLSSNLENVFLNLTGRRLRD